MEAYVRSNDQSAFEALFRRFGPMLHGMAKRQTRSESLASDIVQQTFLQVHRARFDFRQGAKVKPWIFTIATNLVREHFRRKGRRPETSYEAMREETPHIEPSEAPIDLAQLEFEHLDRERIRRALSALPEQQRLVIELHWLQGHPFPEVAKMVGASVSAVKVRAHRGYQRLRSHVEKAREQSEMSRSGSSGISGRQQ